MHILSVINCSLRLISKLTSFLMSTSDTILPSLCRVMLTVSVSEIRECDQDSLHISAYFLKSFWDVFCTTTWRLCLHSILLNVCQEAYTEDSSPGRSSVCRAEAGPVLDSPPPRILQVFFPAWALSCLRAHLTSDFCCPPAFVVLSTVLISFIWWPLEGKDKEKTVHSDPGNLKSSESLA